MSETRRAPSLILLADAMTLALFVAVIGPAVFASVHVHQLLANAWSNRLPGLRVAIDVLVFLVSMLVALAITSRLLPRPVPGRYRFPGHPQSVAWVAQFALMRIGYLPLWKHVLFMFFAGRYCLLRALRAKVPLDFDTALDTMLIDPSLIRIHPGAMLAGGVVVSGHLVESGHLTLGQVTVGEGAQLHAGAKVGPNVSIGAYAIVGPEARIAPDVEVGEYASLGASAFVGTQSRIGANVVIGHQVMLETNVHVGDGAVIASHSVVPSGSRIPEASRFPPRSGAPT